jgi:microcin C transport system permease protein
MSIPNPYQQSLASFRANHRAWWSLLIFLLLFTISLFSELIANDKPLLVRYDSQLYFPFLKSYPETVFGGDFDTEADYHDPYLQELITTKGTMIWPLIPYSFDTHAQDLPGPAPTPPDSNHWLGTDDQARDVVARILYGFRISVLFAIALTLGSSLIGIMAGAIQGYFAGWIDLIGQRLLEIWSGLPILFLLIIMASMVTPSIWWLLLIMLLFSWTSLVDVVRAETLKTRKQEYVRAARALGLSDWAILFHHILPNAMVAALTFLPFLMCGAIGTLTSLDFLGFGLPPSSASIGELLAQGKSNVQAPWLGLSGFFSIAILLTLLVFIGEGVRDAFDPRLNR